MTRFALSRRALLPVFSGGNRADLLRVLTEDGAPLEALILLHQLGPLWHACTNADCFRASRHHASLVYMKQQAALREVDTLLERGGVTYAVMKGAATRELIYDDPALRTCSDIDILVAPDQRIEAARILIASGYKLEVDPGVASHEVVLSKDIVAIDLHWDILRPGRTRVPVTDGLLARRQKHDGWWMLSDNDSLFLMLVHAAVAKHVSTSQTGLHRVADIALWWQRREVDWPSVRTQLSEHGLKTAAWTVLSWVQMLSADSFSPALSGPIASVRPGGLRTAYLRAWLDHDLTARLAKHHAVRLFGFSGFLHDRLSDAYRALGGWRQARSMAVADAGAFEDLKKKGPREA